jgi:putative intracellular protease/amidase
MLLADGVDLQECEQLRRLFEEEGAGVFATSFGMFPSVETVADNRRGRDLLIDIPWEALVFERFDGLIIPDGAACANQIKDERRAVELVRSFHQGGLPIFASGQAVAVLYRSHVLSECVLVREGEPIVSFVNQAVGILLDAPSGPSYGVRMPPQPAW